MSSKFENNSLAGRYISDAMQQPKWTLSSRFPQYGTLQSCLEASS